MIATGNTLLKGVSNTTLVLNPNPDLRLFGEEESDTSLLDKAKNGHTRRARHVELHESKRFPGGGHCPREQAGWSAAFTPLQRSHARTRSFPLRLLDIEAA